MAISDRHLDIRHDPHSGEVLARGGDIEAHSILQRSGFVPVVRLHEHYHRLPTGLEDDEAIRLTKQAVARLTAVGYDVDHDAAFVTGRRILHEPTLGDHVTGLARRIREADHTEQVTDALTELTAPGDGVLAAVGEVLTATADFLHDLGEGSDPYYANRLRYLAFARLGVLAGELGRIRDELADRHLPHPHRSPCPQQVAADEQEASVSCRCPNPTPGPAQPPSGPGATPGRQR
ncbi:hypothetical protein G4Z16_00920 [Streptomyces bathyalis]|uniref:Uncharacterized protein n=1 Tax=Streptomyces bathyalis TaxID=2710756 RepID=A0A7T1WRY9_9ACTN|nr:hypothetical protein [Streptomyces bathyalis]QPP05185.1 hypothetical protein G4Z16_00920 [Streptomyces bathyalis]